MSNEPKTDNALQAIIGVVVAVGFMWFFWGGGLEREAANELDKIEQQVAADSVKQYEIAKRNGSAMDAYVQASLVAAAYLQANDEPNYKKWKAIEKEEAANAGMPSY